VLVNERLTSVFRRVFGDESICLRPEMAADDIEGWDSLTHINLIHAVEQEFKIRFTMSEVARLKNVGDLDALIGNKAR
jgi:acyl carrier protein